MKAGIVNFASKNFQGAMKNFCEAANIRKELSKISVCPQSMITELKVINNIAVTLLFMKDYAAAAMVFENGAL